MAGLRLCIGITDVRLKEKCLQLYRNHGVTVLISMPGKGTAESEMLEYLGIEDTEKSVHMAVVTNAIKEKIMKDFMQQIHYGQKGNGILFTIPFSSIGGSTLMEFMKQGQNDGEEKKTLVFPFDCIIAITNLGCNEMVMKAARKAGATGGTVIYAKGDYKEAEERFFGVTLSAEKEMVFLVVRRSSRNDVMKAIMKEAGMNTGANTIVFSMPVDRVEGILDLEEEMPEESETK